MMMRMMKILKQRVALWQVSAISIVSRGGNKKGVSITPIVIADHRCDGRHDEHGDDVDDDDDDDWPMWEKKECFQYFHCHC